MKSERFVTLKALAYLALCGILLTLMGIFYVAPMCAYHWLRERARRRHRYTGPERRHWRAMGMDDEHHG